MEISIQELKRISLESDTNRSDQVVNTDENNNYSFLSLNSRIKNQVS